MKKKFSALILALITVIVLTCGCGWSTEDVAAVDSYESPFVSISSDIVYGRHVELDNKIFVYDKYTKNIFYLFSNYNASFFEGDHTFTYFERFVNENGKYCKYDETSNTVVETEN